MDFLRTGYLQINGKSQVTSEKLSTGVRAGKFKFICKGMHTTTYITQI